MSHRVVEALRTGRTSTASLAIGEHDLILDSDAQLALWILYELSFRGFDDVPDERESDLHVIRLRTELERRFERELRAVTEPRRSGSAADVTDALEAIIEADDGPPVAAYLHRHASQEEFRDYLRERSVQQLKESDPHSFVLPRLSGGAKVALAELQYDEYGAGRPERLHQRLYAEALAAAGLRDGYAAYVEEVGAASLAAANAISMFGLHRRLRGACLGHLAAFESTSSVPSRKVASGAERLAFPPAVAAYFNEHVEADAVHEQLARHDICAVLVEAEPHLRDDVLFGASACLHLEALVGEELMSRWQPVEAAAS